MGNILATSGRLHRHTHLNHNIPPQQELPPPPDRGFTCEICIEPIVGTTQTLRTKNRNCAHHRFCEDCMIKYIRAKLDDNVPKIRCPALSCPEFLDPHDYEILVGQALFVRWSDALCQLSLMGMDRCYCPNRNCLALIVNECGGTVKKAACPNCKRAFCFQCKLPWHGGFRCEERREWDRYDRAFGVLVEQKDWRRCPQCHHFVELTEGCQIVNCRCLASFCYKCGRQVHQHWCNCDAKSSRCLHTFMLLCFIFYVYIAYLRLE